MKLFEIKFKRENEISCIRVVALAECVAKAKANIITDYADILSVKLINANVTLSPENKEAYLSKRDLVTVITILSATVVI